MDIERLWYEGTNSTTEAPNGSITDIRKKFHSKKQCLKPTCGKRKRLSEDFKLKDNERQHENQKFVGWIFNPRGRLWNSRLSSLQAKTSSEFKVVIKGASDP